MGRHQGRQGGHGAAAAAAPHVLQRSLRPVMTRSEKPSSETNAASSPVNQPPPLQRTLRTLPSS